MSSRPVIEYYFSLISSYSYLGHTEFHRIADKYNAIVVYKPVNIDELFSATGGVPVNKRTAQRQAYRLLELERWSRFRHLQMNKKPKYHPVDTALPHRVVLAIVARLGNESTAVRSFMELAMRAVWIEERDISNPVTVREIATAAGLPEDQFVAQAIEDEEIASMEISFTAEAIERQLFGVPTYVIAGEPFWGQDRLEFLESMLVSGRKPIQLPAV